MVKVILCESPQVCYQYLQDLCVSSASCRVLVHNVFFLEKVRCFYPGLDFKYFRTPTTLLEECSFEPFTDIEACALDAYDDFDDPTLVILENNKKRYSSTYTWWTLPTQSISVKLDTLCFFGPWDKQAQAKIIQQLQENFAQFIHIKRSFLNTHEPPSLNIKPLPSVAAEYFYIQQHWDPEKNVLVELPHSHLQSLSQKPLPFRLQAWLDWQEQQTASTFLIYLSTCVDTETFNRYKKDIEDARQLCLSDRFLLIRSTLLKNKQTWIVPFTLISISDTEESTIPTGLHSIWPSVKFFIEKLPTKEIFIYLRRVLQKQFGYFMRYISWEEAIYLPITSGLIPHAVQTGQNSDYLILPWLYAMGPYVRNFQLCYPVKDASDHFLQPLISAQEKTFALVKCTGKVAPSEPKLQFLTPLTLSCKNWERLAFCPRKTWLEMLMKAEAMHLTQPHLKTKFIGEAVHRNLEFKHPPKTEEEWIEMISKNAHTYWENLLQNQNMSRAAVYQWHQRALQISLKIAHSASEYLAHQRQFWSEWTLPKTAPYTGRIDLFVSDKEQNLAYIIDYKTSLHYAFSDKRIDKGQGLQLFLYGQCLKSYFQSIFLVVIHRNGNKSVLELDKINAVHIQDWLQSVQTTGEYSNPPQEDLYTLPLGYNHF